MSNNEVIDRLKAGNDRFVADQNEAKQQDMDAGLTTQS